MDEEEDTGLRGLAEVLLGYGERHFDGPPNQNGSRRGVWAGVLLMCGQFERVSILLNLSSLLLNDPLPSETGCWGAVGAPGHRN